MIASKSPLEIKARDEPVYLTPHSPPNIAFLCLSGKTWWVQPQRRDLRKLNKLIYMGRFDHNGAGSDKPQMKYCIKFMLTDKRGNHVVAHSISELVEQIDWSNPVATVVLSEGVRRPMAWVSYQTWYEYIGYVCVVSSCCTVNRYCKPCDIPIGWVQHEDRVWYPSAEVLHM